MNFDWTVSFGSLLSALIVATGWIIAYRLNSRKDYTNKKREIRIQFLIEAYKAIAASANREDMSVEEKKEFEAAIEQIQFLGTVRQVNLLVGGTSTRDFTPLLEELRKEVRKESKLDPVEEGIKHFRFNEIETPPNIMQSSVEE